MQSKVHGHGDSETVCISTLFVGTIINRGRYMCLRIICYSSVHVITRNKNTEMESPLLHFVPPPLMHVHLWVWAAGRSCAFFDPSTPVYFFSVRGNPSSLLRLRPDRDTMETTPLHNTRSETRLWPNEIRVYNSERISHAEEDPILLFSLTNHILYENVSR